MKNLRKLLILFTRVNDVIIRSKNGYSLYLLLGTGSFLFPTVAGILVIVIFVVLVRSGIKFQQQNLIRPKTAEEEASTSDGNRGEFQSEPLYNLQQQKFEEGYVPQDFAQEIAAQVYAHPQQEKND